MLTSVPRAFTIRVAALEGLAALVATAGMDFDTVLRRQEIDPSVLDEPDNRITFVQLVRLLDAAAATTGDDCLGLHLGTAQSIHVAGIAGYAMRACPNLHTLLTHAARYYGLHQDGATLEMSSQGDMAVLSYATNDPQVLLHRHDTEATIALVINQCRTLVGHPQWAPDSVHFSHPVPRPASERELRRFFGCPVHFSEPFDGLRFPAVFLETPTRTADAGLFNILARHADECMARHSDETTLIGRARRLIAAGLGNGHAGIDDVARSMAMAPRSLQRRLADVGYQFASLVDETRRELAKHYLRDPRITLTDAAFLVGYSDLTAFHRAFRRWFNQTPLEYKRQSGR